MIKSAINISRLVFSGIIVLANICFASCTVDHTDDLPDMEFGSSEYVRIGAEVRQSLSTRADEGENNHMYQEQGPVTDGEFVLTYVSNYRYEVGTRRYTYSQANASFGGEGIEDMGFVWYMQPVANAEPKRTQLKWADIKEPWGTSNSATTTTTTQFYLDNVPTGLHAGKVTADAGDGNIVLFETTPKKDDDKYDFANDQLPFIAGKFDDVYGTNDLLWGTASAARYTKIVKFELHHNMSRVRVNISVRPQDETELRVDLSHAKLELTNVHLRPVSFDRVTGNLALPENDDTKGNIVLVDQSDESNKDPEWLDYNDTDRPEHGTYDSDEKKGIETDEYYSCDFVLPPQTLVNTSERPTLRLTIPVKDAQMPEGEWSNYPNGEVVYEQALPQNMYYIRSSSEDDSTTRQPMLLSFMKEHVLTIHAIVGPPDMELEFAPVYVQDWIYLDEQKITGRQAGIYSQTEFMGFLNSYVNCIKTGKVGSLEKYGFWRNEKEWSIMFWTQKVELQRADIEGYMLKHVVESDGAKTAIDAAIAQAKDSNSTWPVELKKMIEEDTELSEDVKKEITDAQKDIEDTLTKFPFVFTFNNYVIKITDDEAFKEGLTGAYGQTLLYNWVTGSDSNLPGIKTVEDLKKLVNVYNDKSTSGMQKYGAYDNTYEQWVFEFTSDADQPFTLSYNDIMDATKIGRMNFLKDGKFAYNFAFNFRGKAVTITDLPNMPEGKNSITLSGDEGEAILHALMISPSGLYSAEDVQLLIKAYNSLDKTKSSTGGDAGVGGTEPEVDEDYSWMLPLFGTKNTNGSWTFTFYKSVDLEGPEIYGTMIPDAEKGLPDYSFATDKSDTEHPAAVKVSDNGSIHSYMTSPPSDSGYRGIGEVKLMFANGGYVDSASRLNGVAAYDKVGSDPIYRRLYGWYDESDNMWVYPISKSFDVNLKDTNGKDNTYTYEYLYGRLGMPAEPMRFVIPDGMSVTFEKPDGTKLVCRGAEGEDILYQILSGTYDDTPPSPGLESTADFANLFTAYNATTAADKAKLGLYGTYDETAAKWTFNFTKNAADVIELPYNNGSIIGKMKGGDDFEFDLGTHTVKITGLPGGDLELKGAKGATLLHAILTDPDSIASKTEFEMLIEAYNSGKVATMSAPTGGYTPMGTFSTPMNNFSSPMRSFSTPMNTVMPLDDAANNEWILGLFGTKESGTWTFNINGQVQFDGPTEVYGQMIPDTANGKPEYEFSYQSGGVQVVDGVTEPVAPADLKKLFANSGKITSGADIDKLIAAITDANAVTRRFYGTYNGSKWTFPVEGTLSVDYETIRGQLVGKLTADDFDFDFVNGATVTVTGLPGDRTVECEGDDGAKTLKKIMLGTYTPRAGIEKEGDIAKLTAAYPDDEETLKIYGTKSGDTWTFTFYESMNLDGRNVFGKMISDTNYEFAYNPTSISVTVGGEAVTAAQLKILFSNGGEITSAEDIDELIAATNDVTRRYYGWTDAAGTKWTFPVTKTMTNVVYGDIKGKLADDNYSFEFATGVTVTVTGLPGGREVKCEDTGGAATLKKIMLGTYQPEVGILKETDIQGLIDSYNGSRNDLEAYGTKDSNGTWTFTIRTQLTLTSGAISGKMIPGADKPDYTFAYDTTTSISVTVDNVAVDAAPLKVLFSNGGKIASAADLKAIINANLVERRYYGTYNGSKWTFPVTSPIEDVAYNEIKDTLKDKFTDATLSFEFATGVTVTVTGLPGDRTVKCEGDDGATTLKQIMLGTYQPKVGILTDGDVQRLIDSYNGTQTDLEAYGTKDSNGMWTFTIRTSLALSSGAISGQMIPDTENGKPDYMFDYAPDVTVTVDGEAVDATKLKDIFSAVDGDDEDDTDPGETPGGGTETPGGDNGGDGGDETPGGDPGQNP